VLEVAAATVAPPAQLDPGEIADLVLTVDATGAPAGLDDAQLWLWGWGS
jgi:hypothetical protein